jgi:hypothetical protein
MKAIKAFLRANRGEGIISALYTMLLLTIIFLLVLILPDIQLLPGS